MIYFDNAATTGRKPRNVKSAVNYALENLCANPGRGGYDRAIKASEALYGARKKISDFFGGNGAERVVFCNNCTEAVNIVVKGNLKAGDHVVVSDLEHNAVMRPLHKIGILYSIAKVSFDDDLETLKEFEDKITENTKMVICTSASNVTGKILPIKGIGDICKRKNILFAVDGAQGGGIIPINMREMNIDYLCIAGHKGLYAPMGSGVLIANKDIKNTLIEGGNGLNSLELSQPPILPEGFESGTVGLPSVMGIGAGIDFINNTGMEKLYNHELSLVQYVFSNLSKDKRFTVYGNYPENGKYVPVMSFNVRNTNSVEVADYLNKNGIAVRSGFHCSKLAHNKLGTTLTGTVRISMGYFNNSAEAERFVGIIKKMKNSG